MDASQMPELFDWSQPHRDLLFDVLFARGFLLQKSDDRIMLSDNALLHRQNQGGAWGRGVTTSDLEFLEWIVDRGVLDCVIHGLEIRPGHRRPSPDQVWSIFSHRCRIGGEAGYMKHLESFNYFKRDYPHKIPLCLLEPFVALLVKALSSVGVASWCSCDGHGTRGVSVSLVGVYSAYWTKALWQGLVRREARRVIWQLRGDTLTLEDNSARYDGAYYREILDAGKLLYGLRVELRRRKKSVVERCDRRTPLEVVMERMTRALDGL